MARKKKEEEKENVSINSADILKSHLSATKERHFNFDDEVDFGKVSSGSLNIDLEIGGGFEPCIIRPTGNTQSGKTASTLQYIKSFLDDTTKKRRAIYIKSEGRLSKSKRDNSGVKFVVDANDWEDGTCFIYKTNIYEDVINLLRSLVDKKNNIPYTQYWFVFDSMDGLISKEDFEKKAGEALKVAGGALLTSDFLRKFSLYMHETGHYCSMIGQMRSSGPQNQYAEKSQKVGSASGGNAIQHYADWICEYYSPNRFIFEDYSVDKKSTDTKRKPIGHYARFIIKKGDKDERDIPVEYPILYNQTGGNAVIKELEVYDVCLALGFINKGGAWFSFKDFIVDLFNENGIENVPEKIQGAKSVIQYLKENPNVTNILYDYCLNFLQASKL